MGKRAKIVAEIEHAIAVLSDRPGQCFYYANEVARVLFRHGFESSFKRGHCNGQGSAREEDDGTSRPTSVTLSTSSDAKSRPPWTPELPEIHVWVGIVQQQMLIDFSTRHLRDAAKQAGLDWTAEYPPEFLWCSAMALPDWVVYTVDPLATVYAANVLNHLFQPAYLRRRVIREKARVSSASWHHRLVGGKQLRPLVRPETAGKLRCAAVAGQFGASEWAHLRAGRSRRVGVCRILAARPTWRVILRCIIVGRQCTPGAGTLSPLVFLTMEDEASGCVSGGKVLLPFVIGHWRTGTAET